MTAVVSEERAKATWLTGIAGLVILAVALVMMACAAPSLARPGPHPAMALPASAYASRQVTVNWPTDRPASPARCGPLSTC